ncbi:hypothetical protein [Pseudomonas mosselii]|uniref:hypothetical protein n=1 Tax=Pseudomonas mosselii TaxID=78327 RepID=UPI0021D81496|nr:hypothetical protein [Pseudomonas mosselii]MCU9529332.1 hypothetical protein [Pseudomonas mosselii]MCU9536623.1 hypothetical protein [Pseudomonas mosselii]MCU9542243.1 hypothetical protein [Pseudomonas mosselii]MCU9548348.1 hypothetical protein [Pseudomonas mosselii]
MQTTAGTVVQIADPEAYQASNDVQAAAVRKELSFEAIRAEREAITQSSKARYEAGDRTGLPSPSGHYMAGDAAGMIVIDWMTEAERARFHVLGLALPTAGEEREAARLRIQNRISARRARREACV